MPEQTVQPRSNQGWSAGPWKPAGVEPRPVPPARARPGWLHFTLFMLTVCTCTVAGVGLAHHPAPLSMWIAAVTVYREPVRLLEGVAFSGPLLAILLAHEMGHYWMARVWRVPTGWPLFVPLPLGLGTMGALMRLDGPVPPRRALLEIGAAGPLVGFVVAVVFTLVGLGFSTVKTGQEMEMFIHLGGLVMPDSAAFAVGRWVMFGTLPPERFVVPHPMALAGWFGLYLTWFNLLPFAQLDGGHMAFALWPAWGRRLSVMLLAICGLLAWAFSSTAWMALGIGLVILGALSGLDHPPPDGTDPPLGPRQRVVALVCLAVFLLCLVPNPMPGTRG